MQPVVKQQIIEILGYFWNSMFLDSDFVQSWATSIAVPIQDLNQDFSTLSEYMSRYTIPVKEPQSIRLFVFDEALEDRNANRYGDDGLIYGGGTAYGQETTSIDPRRFPIEPGYEPRFLATSIKDPGAILEKDVDYEIEDGWIVFFKDPLAIPSLYKKAITGSDKQTYFQFLFWGFQVRADINALCDYYGIMVGVCGPSEIWSKESINVAWDLRVDGASVRNVQRLLAVMTHTDYVSRAGKVKEIYTEGDRICVATENDVYTAPVESSPVIRKGDTLQSDQIIFDTYSIHLGTEDIPGPDFDGLALGPEYLPVLGASILFPNERVDITKTRNPGWFTLESE
jgi:hypothetical protein